MICHTFENISRLLLVSWLPFRHKVASTMTARDFDVSYIVTNPCIVSETTCMCKTNRVIGISGNLLAIVDF